MAIENVLLIMADQLRKDTLGCYGNDCIHTPHLDALAADGVRYERCYTANPLCMPSRHSLISGMLPHNHGVFTNGVLAKDGGRTLPHWLLQRGWQTASIGKMHLEPTLDKEGKKSREAKVHWRNDPSHEVASGYWGYGYIRSTVGHSVVTGGYREWFLQNGGDDAMFGVKYTGAHTGGMQIPARLHCTSYIAEKAEEFLHSARDKGRPFFLTVSFPDPHFPFTPPAELVGERRVKPPVGDAADLAGRPARYRQFYEGRWSPGGAERLEAAKDTPQILVGERIARTYEMVEWMDRAVGRVVRALMEEGLYEKTAIFFLSDHGELLGDHGLWFKGPFFYEGLLNVPLLCVDHRRHGETDGRLVSLVDLAPAICGLLGIESMPWADGTDFLDEKNVRRHCLVEYRNGYRRQGRDFAACVLVTKGDKLVRYDDGSCEFTDLEADPKEKKNRALDPSYQERIREREGELLTELLRMQGNRYEQICPN